MKFLDDYEFLLAPLVFTALAFFTRMWKIGISNIVTWDEAQYAIILPRFYHILLRGNADSYSFPVSGNLDRITSNASSTSMSILP